jgi:glycerate-2-kinase
MHEQEMEAIAAIAHGGAVVLSTLGAAYNWIRSRRLLDVDALIQTAAAIYHFNAARKHVSRVSRLKSNG